MIRPAFAASTGCLMLWASIAGGQQPPEIVVQSGGKAPTAIRYGAQGRWVVTGGADRRLRIYDTQSGRLLRVLTLPDSGVPTYAAPAMAAHPRENRVAAAVSSGDIAIFDIETGAEVWRTSGTLMPRALEFSEDGTKLFGALMAWTPSQGPKQPRMATVLKAWDTATHSEITRTLEDLTPAGFSVDGAWVYGQRSGESYRKGIIVDRTTGQDAGPQIDGIISATHAGAGRALVMRGDDARSAQVALIDVVSGKAIATWPGVGGTFSPRGDRVLIMGMQTNWKIANAATGQEIFPGDPSVASGPAWTFSPDGATIALAQIDAVALVSASSPDKPRVLGNQAAPLITSQAMVAASGGGEEAKRVERQYSSVFGGATNTRPAAAFTPDGRWLVVRAADGQLDVWDASTGNRMPFRIPSKLQSKEALYAAADGRFLSVRSEVHQSTDLVDKKIGRKMYQYPSMQESFTAQRIDIAGARVAAEREMTAPFLCASADGTYAVEITGSGKKDFSLNLRATVDGRILTNLKSTRFSLFSGCSISPDGSRLVVAKSDGKLSQMMGFESIPMMKAMGAAAGGAMEMVLEVLDVSSGRAIELKDGNGRATPLRFSPSGIKWSADGKYVAGGGKDFSFLGAFVPHGPIQVWDATTGNQVRVLPGSGSSALGLTPDGAYVIVTNAAQQPGNDSYGIEIWEARSGNRVLSLADAVAAPDTLIVGPKGKTVAAPDRDGGLSFWDRASGKLLGQLRAMQEGEWLVTTPSGAFDGSPRGWNQIAWRGAGGKTETASGELFFNEFYRPGLLADIVDGRSPRQMKPIADLDRRQPLVVISASANGQRHAAVRIEVAEAPAGAGHTMGSGVRDLRLFRNGTLVKTWRGDLALGAGGKAVYDAIVPVTAGQNRFVAYAFNRDNIKSPDASATLVRIAPARKGAVYVLAIGVNEYTNREFNLQYAVPDAMALAQELGRTQAALAQTDSVQVVSLLNAEATRANILWALERLGGKRDGDLAPGTPASLGALRAAEPEDTVIIYFAGHGLAHGDRFYLIPHDLGYAGPRDQLRGALAEVLTHGISDLDLERAVEPIDARHLMLIIDACQSGQAIESEEERRGPMNSRGLAQLAYEKGMSILTASQAYQAALESSRLGHGYLTFALVEEGLKTAAADVAPLDGVVTAGEWFEYAARRVPQMQIEALEQARQQGRLLTFEPGGAGAGQARLQTPRFFSKRDTSGALLIVAKSERRVSP